MRPGESSAEAAAGISRPLSGHQYELECGDYRAVVASVGASLRELTYQGRPLVVGFAADQIRPNFRGTTLAPWPNRIVDGRYTFAGRELQVPLTEPTRAHALHGLVCWVDFEPAAVSAAEVTLTTVIEAQAGYPWRVAVATTYRLDGAGLTQSVRGTNLTREAAPWGTAPHPYLRAGDSPLDTWILELPATHVLEVTEDRLSPVRLSRVDAANPVRFDFRSGRPIGAAEIDHAYTGLTSVEGMTTVSLTDPTGGGVAMSWGAACPWIQVHTADLPGAAPQDGHRIGLAVEPMTCAPDAFNAERYAYGTGLLVLEPGASHDVRWSIRAT